MSDYRRVFVPGGTYFFTAVTAERRTWLGTLLGRSVLAQAMRATRSGFPFSIIAIVILDDHLHTIWKLPDDDHDYSTRWKSIKQRSTNMLRRSGMGTGPFWQPRYWEHLIRDETDLHRHIDYVHYNPVKHGLCASPGDWPASTFQRYVDNGMYTPDWGGPAEDFEVPE